MFARGAPKHNSIPQLSSATLLALTSMLAPSSADAKTASHIAPAVTQNIPMLEMQLASSNLAQGESAALDSLVIPGTIKKDSIYVSNFDEIIAIAPRAAINPVFHGLRLPISVGSIEFQRCELRNQSYVRASVTLKGGRHLDFAFRTPAFLQDGQWNIQLGKDSTQTILRFPANAVVKYVGHNKTDDEGIKLEVKIVYQEAGSHVFQELQLVFDRNKLFQDSDITLNLKKITREPRSHDIKVTRSTAGPFVIRANEMFQIIEDTR